MCCFKNSQFPQALGDLLLGTVITYYSLIIVERDDNFVKNRPNGLNHLKEVTPFPANQITGKAITTIFCPTLQSL